MSFSHVTEKFVRSDDSYPISAYKGLDKDQYNLSSKPLALISGAGIAGLAAAFELIAKDFEVILVEKRETFSRANIINLNMEVQDFLRRFNLLEEFEESVAARIKKHKYVIVGKNGLHALPFTDVSSLNFEGQLPKSHQGFGDLFMKEGIYSIQIKDLQAFLATKAAQFGAHILCETEVHILHSTEKGRVAKVEIVQKNNPDSPLILAPDLFFIAEGAHSTTVDQLSLGNDELINNCTGENWVFGNLKYTGKKTFVVSIINTTQKTLQIANVIFNGKIGMVNVSVTSDEHPDHSRIIELIYRTAQIAFSYAGILEQPEIVDTVRQPVHIINQIATICSHGNVYRIGDAVGHSSPLAGLGGTLGLTLVPRTIERLLKDCRKLSEKRSHEGFRNRSLAYVARWMKKSEDIKTVLQNLFTADGVNDAH